MTTMKMRFKANILSSFLLAVLLVVDICKLLHQIPILVLAERIDASTLLSPTTASCDESLTAPSVLDCPNVDLLKMSYISMGSIDCGGALTVDQAAISPSIKADPSIVEEDGLYSLVLVDTTTLTTTTDTFFSIESVHPILLYGAVNIQGSALLEGLSLDQIDGLDVFSAYRGPSPRKPNSVGATPGVENTLFLYEYMLASQAQTDAPIEVSELVDGSILRFDYKAFFEETVGVEFSNLASSTYFVSGWCVREPTTTTTNVLGRKDPTEAPTAEVKSPTEPPTAEVKSPTEPPTVPLKTISAVEAESNGESDKSSQTNNEKQSKAPPDPPSADAVSRGVRSISVTSIGMTGLAVLGVVVTTWFSEYY